MILRAGTMTIREVIDLLMLYPFHCEDVEKITTFENYIVVTLKDKIVYVGYDGFEEYEKNV